MDLAERYVNAVGERLHPSRRSNVEAELRATIMDAIDARSPAPTDDDVVAVLAEMGDPSQMVAEYEPARQYLIGPELFPLFTRVLRVTCVTLLLASAFAFGVALLIGGFADFRAGQLLIDALVFTLLATLVSLVVLVTVFAWLQRSEVRLPRAWFPARPSDSQGGAWDPRTLPAVHATEHASRFEVIVGLVAAAVMLVVLGGIGWAANQTLPHAAEVLRPLIHDVVIVNILLCQAGLVISAIAHVAALVQGGWQSPARVARLIADAIGVFVFVRLPFQLAEHRSAMLEAGASANVVNWLIGSAIAVAIVLVAIVAAYWWRVWRRSRTHDPDGRG